jgi:ABC-2 type transport system ATP-binding protein
MQQRVGLAQALLNEPALVFLDEPTSGLDPVGRYEVREVIRELRQRGVTVFLNSHYLSEVEVTCDRVAIVKRGRLMRAGTLAELTAGALQIEIRAAGLTAALLAGLAQWGQISDGKLQTTEGEAQMAERVTHHVSRVTLTIADESVLPAIAEYLVQGGARLYSLAPRRASLEELFIQVMAEEAA